MQKRNKKILNLILSLLLMIVLIPIGSKMINAEGATKEIAVGTEYYIGDTIKLSKNTYIICDDEYGDEEEIYSGEYKLISPIYIVDNSQYGYFFEYEGYGDLYFWLGYNKVNGTETVAGVKCISGTGEKGNPFVFELILSSPTLTILDKVELSIVPPLPGEKIGDVRIANHSADFCWVNAAPWTDAESNVLTGNFVEGYDYYAELVIRPRERINFNSSTQVIINNAEVLGTALEDDGDLLIRIKATCAKHDQVKVSFELNGGIMTEGQSERFINFGSYVVEPDPFSVMKEGKYWFDGWYADEDLRIYYDFYKPIFTDTKIYAKFQEYCDAKADFGGGTIGDETGFEMKVRVGDKDKIPTVEEFIDMGYQAPPGTQYVGIIANGIQYKPGDRLTFPKDILNVSVINLPIGDILTFDLDGGTLGDQVGTAFFSHPNNSEINLPIPTKEGFTFDYWEGSRYEGGALYKVDGDHLFKAIWKVNTPVNPTPHREVPNTSAK